MTLNSKSFCFRLCKMEVKEFTWDYCREDEARGCLCSASYGVGYGEGGDWFSSYFNVYIYNLIVSQECILYNTVVRNRVKNDILSLICADTMPITSHTFSHFIFLDNSWGSIVVTAMPHPPSRKRKMGTERLGNLSKDMERVSGGTMT